MFSRIINTLYSKILIVVATVILAVLSFVSLFSTTLMADGDEFVFIVKDSVLKNVAVLAIIIGLACFSSKRGWIGKLNSKLDNDVFFKRAEKICLIAIFALGTFWVLNVQTMPIYDQADIMRCAYEIKQGNFTSIEPGGYIDAHRNQIGITVLLMAISNIIGDCNYVVVGILNVIGLVLAYKYILASMRVLGTSRMAQFVMMVVAVLFWPFIMYASYVYGIIWHTTLAIIAFYYVLKFLQGYKWTLLLWAAVLTGLCIIVKSNALIFYIAIVIYLIVNADWKKFNAKVVAAFIGMLVLPILMSKVPVLFIEKTTPLDVEQGIPMNAYAYMGLTFSGDAPAPGWYNNFVDNIYEEKGFSKEATAEEVSRLFGERMSELKGNPTYTYTFFLQKIVSMWNEPTYESFLVTQNADHNVDMAAYIDWFMSPAGYGIFVEIEKVMQLLIYIGALAWLLFERKESFVVNSFWAMCFVGGFLFHFVWEAKSQYALSYVVLLLPCSILGWELLLKIVVHGRGKLEVKEVGNVNSSRKQHIFCLLAGVVAVATFVLAIGSYTYVGTANIRNSRDVYKEYAAGWTPKTHTRTFVDVNQYIYNSEMYWLFKEENEYLKGILDREEVDY